MASFTSFMEYVLKLPNPSTPKVPAAASDGAPARANRESATRQALDLCMTLLLHVRCLGALSLGCPHVHSMRGCAHGGLLGPRPRRRAIRELATFLGARTH